MRRPTRTRKLTRARAARGLRKGRVSLGYAVQRMRDARRSSYMSGTFGYPAAFIGSSAAPAVVSPPELLVANVLAHRFDLLGSGPVHVRRGAACPGFDGTRFAPVLAPGTTPNDLARQVAAANRHEAERVRAFVDDGYSPIDWQLDFKSGYRWSEAEHHTSVRVAPERGVDIKMPWELGRCQHLPLLGLAAAAQGDIDVTARLAREFRNQVLDFVAANPPRYGVQWASTMDVAIRAANWLLAWDLFSGKAADFDDTFVEVLSRSLFEHGHHIRTNLEPDRDRRTNHYLADVAGLVWLGAYLPPGESTDEWLRFGASELLTEVTSQFHEEGSNFEGSTSYHRLSAEIAIYSVALLLRVSQDQPDRLRTLDWHSLENGARSVVSDAVLSLLSRAIEFTRAMTKADGRIVQIGDNDSGRFFRLTVPGRSMTPAEAAARYSNLAWLESTNEHGPVWIATDLDHRHLADALAGILGGAVEKSGSLLADGWVAARLAQAEGSWVPAEVSQQGVEIGDTPALEAFRQRIRAVPTERCRTYSLEVDGPSVMTGGSDAAYPAFGVFVYRSDRIYLAVRCGPIGQRGFGGHDHNDQLALELSVDAVDWIADPGTYVYTADLAVRGQYRSSRAHFVPRLAGAEPASLDVGAFELGAGSEARCIYWDGMTFAGELRTSDGRVALCEVSVLEHGLRVVHVAEHGELEATAGDGGWRDAQPTVAFSPAYGVRVRRYD